MMKNYIYLSALAVLMLLQTFAVHAEIIEPGKTGRALIEALRAVYAPRQTLSYSQARERMFAEIDNIQGVVRLIYTGVRFPTSAIPDPDRVNTEHVFAVQYATRPAVRINPAEHVRYQWLPRDQALARVSSRTNREAIARCFAVR